MTQKRGMYISLRWSRCPPRPVQTALPTLFRFVIAHSRWRRMKFEEGGMIVAYIGINSCNASAVSEYRKWTKTQDEARRRSLRVFHVPAKKWPAVLRTRDNYNIKPTRAVFSASLFSFCFTFRRTGALVLSCVVALLPLPPLPSQSPLQLPPRYALWIVIYSPIYFKEPISFVQPPIWRFTPDRYTLWLWQLDEFLCIYGKSGNALTNKGI